MMKIGVSTFSVENDADFRCDLAQGLQKNYKAE